MNGVGLIEVYKMINTLSSVNFDNFFEFDTNRSTRDQGIIYIPVRGC